MRELTRAKSRQVVSALKLIAHPTRKQIVKFLPIFPVFLGFSEVNVLIDKFIIVCVVGKGRGKLRKSLSLWVFSQRA